MNRLALTLSLLVVATPALGIPTLVLDDPHQTITRPMSGFVDVQFFGNLKLDEGDVVNGVGGLGAYSSSGDLLMISDPSLNPDRDSEGSALRFWVRVHSDSPTGLYNLAGPNNGDLAYWELGVTTGAGEFISLRQVFSVTVVESIAVSEPSTFALLGAGLLGLGFMRRERAS